MASLTEFFHYMNISPRFQSDVHKRLSHITIDEELKECRNIHRLYKNKETAVFFDPSSEQLSIRF